MLAASLVGVSRGAAQLPPVGVPPGLLRIELGGEFNNYDSRYFHGATQDIFRGFTTDALGGGFFPTAADAESRIGRIIGQAGYRLNAGRTTANGLVTIGTASISLAYGLTRRITVFALAPFVRTSAQIHLVFDSVGADAGFNPADPVFGDAAGRGQAVTFFTEFNAALTTLDAKINNGDYDANPSQKAQAQAALTDGTALRDDLLSILINPESPFVPLQSSTAGTGIVGAVTTLQGTLGGLSVPGFSSLPPLASHRLAPSDFAGFVSNPFGPVAGVALDHSNKNQLGDVEMGAAFTLIDRWNRASPGDSGKPQDGGMRIAFEGRVRFPTGLKELPQDFIDIGTTSGHLATRFGATVDWGRGRFGMRLTGTWEHMFPATVERRVSLPSQPIVPASRQTSLRRTPGNMIDLAVTPFFRLASTLAIQAGVRHSQHSVDRYAYASNASALAGISPDLLATDSDWSLTAFIVGITYASPAAADPAQKGFPVEAWWTVEGPLSGGGGIVAKQKISRVGLRFYRKFW